MAHETHETIDSSKTCAQPAERLSAFVDGDLSTAEAQAVRAHLTACARSARCRSPS